MEKHTYKEIKGAAEALGLLMYETRAEIESKYRALVKEIHPDSAGIHTAEQNQKMAQVNGAYKIIKNYLDNYVFLFDEQAVYRYNFDSAMMERMRKDSAWGPG